MRHRLSGRKLNRNSSQRKALLRALATHFLEHGRITTTVVRAKELRRVVEPLITMAKTDTVNHRRMAREYLFTKSSIIRLFKEVAPAHKDRPGGYTRTFKLGFRPGDSARKAFMELVDMPFTEVKETVSKDVSPALPASPEAEV